MRFLDLSDWGFAAGISALLAFGWTTSPDVPSPHQRPLAVVAVSQLAERHLQGDMCAASGTLANVGDVPLVDAELFLTFEAAAERNLLRITAAASERVDRVGPGQRRHFELEYACSDALGSRRYRVMAGAEPVPVRERSG